MKIKQYLLEIFIIMIIICTFFVHSYALDPQTHKDLNKYIANNTIDGFSLDAYLQEQLGLKAGIEESFNSKQIWKWLRDGGKYEDEPPWTIPYLRSVNHFHNPLEPDIEKAGFTGIWGTGILSGKSSILWSQKPAGEQSPGGYYSWHDARGYFYTALTATDKATQDSNFAETFRALGQLMHLVQDISVPAHTRDDGHVMYNYETWVKNNFIKYADLSNYLSIYPPISFDKSAIGNSNSQASVPAANLFDTNQYNGSNPVTTLQSNIGLSEYTNANFLSSDTMFTDDDFPFPKAEHCVIVFDTPPNGIPDLDRKYLSSTNGHPGEQINHLAVVSYIRYFRKLYFPNISSEQLPVSLDPACYEDYASKLIPRAVGYSAGLLDYFFRGQLEITAPEAFVYSVIDGSVSPQQFTHIKAKVKNITPGDKDENGNVLTYEDMLAGTLVAVARYKKRTDYEEDLSTDPPTAASREDDFSYSVSEPVEITSLSDSDPEEFTFNFTETPIPAGIMDLYFQVIFQGTLGNEPDNAIAVGMKDLNEPMHICFWNATDRFYLDGVLRTGQEIRNDPDLLERVDIDGDGIVNETGEPYIDPYDLDTEVTFYSTTDTPPNYYHASYLPLPYGRHGRVIMLTDAPTFYLRIHRESTEPSETSNAVILCSGVSNQEDNEGILHNTQVSTFRGIIQHQWWAYARYSPDFTGISIAPWPEPEDTEQVPITTINP